MQTLSLAKLTAFKNKVFSHGPSNLYSTMTSAQRKSWTCVTYKKIVLIPTKSHYTDGVVRGKPTLNFCPQIVNDSFLELFYAN